MTITIDLGKTAQPNPPSPISHHRAPQRLLVLNNPGRVSRFYLDGIISAARRMGLEHRTCELADLWARSKADLSGLRRDMTDWCRRERIGAVIGYVFNGLTELGIRASSTDPLLLNGERGADCRIIIRQVRHVEVHVARGGISAWEDDVRRRSAVRGTGVQVTR